MGKHHLSKATSGYRTYVENVELSPLVQHNASPEDNSRTTVTVTFRDVTEKKTCRQIGHLLQTCSYLPKTTITNLYNSCTYGSKSCSSTRSNTFDDFERLSNTGPTTSLLQLSDHSSTCEVIQWASSSLIS
ncbi:hypothetical protein TNCV_1011441 [Trichonephila clavipes]|uniref:Uncharacterized protein n=1 Tax=Trichonephila clavipes TaxID=2585209 RepID=A0A8X7B9C7_TRICX|nr:hypothetical protein TNCV_1011441 [Trichonephila clavipes]